MGVQYILLKAGRGTGLGVYQAGAVGIDFDQGGASILDEALEGVVVVLAHKNVGVLYIYNNSRDNGAYARCSPNSALVLLQEAIPMLSNT